MRWLLAILVIVGTACTEHGKGGGVFCQFMGDVHQVGDQFPAGDNCNTCSCDIDGNVVCTDMGCIDGGLPDGPNACAPSGGCPNGPVCGGTCCAFGESCLNNSCSCGGNAACSNGDMCTTGGPAGSAFCGSICCGGTTGCPI